MPRLLILFILFANFASAKGIECGFTQRLASGTLVTKGNRLIANADNETYSLIDFVRSGEASEPFHTVRFKKLECAFMSDDAFLATCHTGEEGATVLIKRTVETFVVAGFINRKMLGQGLESRERFAFEIEPNISLAGKAVKRDRMVWEYRQCKPL